MALRAATNITPDEAHSSRADAWREVAAVRHLYRLHRELATDLAELRRRRRLRADALIALAVLVLALMGGFMVDVAPRCTDMAPPSATLLIGDAIKVAGC
jgi:ferric-dicitrate binding protein FerR (iron transport regulator)